MSRVSLAGKRDFTNIFQECVCEALKNALGEECMRTIFFHLELDQHANNPKEIHEKLCPLFKQGAEIIEKIIVKELFRRANLPYEERGNFDFERYVNLGRKFLTTKSLKETE